MNRGATCEPPLPPGILRPPSLTSGFLFESMLCSCNRIPWLENRRWGRRKEKERKGRKDWKGSREGGQRNEEGGKEGVSHSCGAGSLRVRNRARQGP